MPSSNQSATRASAGGSAGARGTTFQAQVVAWWLGQLLLQSRSANKSFDIPVTALPLRAGGQSGEPTDDVLVEFDDGARLFVQCKTSLDITEKVYAANGKKTPFASAWEQFGLQLLKDGSGVTADRLVLAFSQWTGPMRELADVLSRFRDHGGTLALDHRRVAVTGSEKKTARKLLALLDELEKSLPLADLRLRRSEWLGKVYLYQLPLEREAESWGHLEDLIRSGVVADPAEAGRVLGELFTLGDKAHIERTSFGIDQVRQALRLEGIWLKDVPNQRPPIGRVSRRVPGKRWTTSARRWGEDFCLPRSGVQSQIASAVGGRSGYGRRRRVRARARAPPSKLGRPLWTRACTGWSGWPVRISMPPRSRAWKDGWNSRKHPGICFRT